MLVARSVPNSRPLRRSMTAAMRGGVLFPRVARSAIVGSSPGGRFSMTYQSRSSRDLAVVLFPAPDIPVMITTSAGGLAIAASSCLLTRPAPASARVSRRPPAAGFAVLPAQSALPRAMHAAHGAPPAAGFPVLPAQSAPPRPMHAAHGAPLPLVSLFCPL